MISLTRNYLRNVNFLTGVLAAGSQVRGRKSFCCRSTGVNIPNSVFVTKSSKGFTDFKTSLRKLSNQNIPHQDYNGVFTDILNDLGGILDGYKLNDTLEWLTTILKYNLRNSENISFLLLVQTYENLVNTTNVKSENMRLAHVLGWCIEIQNTASLMLEDIMVNSSSYRRGQKCWHKLDNVGLSCGLNDAFLIANTVHVLIKKNFRHMDCYLSLMELLHETSFISGCGQSVDMTFVRRPVSSFNMETYISMSVNKAAFNNFYLPFALAAQLAGFTDEEALRQSKDIILQIGLFYKIRNDFLDCFGTLETAGKVGTNIQDHKYSWLAVTCMERATKEQKQIMIECYGKNDPESVKKVKQLYETLNLPNVYATYEKESYGNIKTLIKLSSSSCITHELLLKLLNRIYRRDS